MSTMTAQCFLCDPTKKGMKWTVDALQFVLTLKTLCVDCRKNLESKLNPPSRQERCPGEEG
jgi:hypothetical protein